MTKFIEKEDELTARLMVPNLSNKNYTLEEAGGYMPLETYQIDNADETVKALIKTINYNARRSGSLERENHGLVLEIRELKDKLNSPRGWLKFIILNIFKRPTAIEKENRKKHSFLHKNT